MQQMIEREQSLVRQFQDGTSVQRLAVLHRRSQRYVEDVLRQAMMPSAAMGCGGK